VQEVDVALTGVAFCVDEQEVDVFLVEVEVVLLLVQDVD
jgi:hypothetical protein